MPTDRHFRVKYWICQKDVSILPHEAKALLELFCFQLIIFVSRQIKLQSLFCLMRQNKNTWFYIGGSGLDRTNDFQKFCGLGLDRIQFHRMRTWLGLKNFTVRSSLPQTSMHWMFGGSAYLFAIIKYFPLLFSVYSFCNATFYHSGYIIKPPQPSSAIYGALRLLQGSKGTQSADLCLVASA